MKTAFFEGRYDGRITLPDEIINALPKRIVLMTTVQFLDSLPGIKDAIARSGRKAVLPKALHAAHDGQVLGCSLLDAVPEAKKADCFLYIGDGLFHPKQLMLKNSLPVFSFNPISNEFRKLASNDVEAMRRRIKGAHLKFLTSQRIGIIVSTKPGQNKLAAAKKLKSKLVKEGKEAYLFVADTIDFSEMENFPFVEIFVNTACPRIAYDDYEKFPRPIIDLGDLDEKYKK